MGRYIASGIAAKITVYKTNNNRWYNDEYDIIKNKNKLLQKMKFINYKDYDIEMYENGYELKIKPEIFDKNIHSILKEQQSLRNGCYFTWYIFGNDTKENEELVNLLNEQIAFESYYLNDEIMSSITPNNVSIFKKLKGNNRKYLYRL